MTAPIVTEAEIVKLVKNAIRHSGPLSEEEIFRVVRWAERARIAAAAVDGALHGQLGLFIKDGELKIGRAQSEKRQA